MYSNTSCVDQPSFCLMIGIWHVFVLILFFFWLLIFFFLLKAVCVVGNQCYVEIFLECSTVFANSRSLHFKMINHWTKRINSDLHFDIVYFVILQISFYRVGKCSLNLLTMRSLYVIFDWVAGCIIFGQTLKFVCTSF